MPTNTWPMFMAVNQHLHALRHGFSNHPAIWGDFHLRANTWNALLARCVGMGRPLTIVETGTARVTQVIHESQGVFLVEKT